jgi:hypothetical protein
MKDLPKHLIYKKSLFVELVRLDHNFLYSTRNRENEKYQVYVFELTDRLIRDIVKLNGKDYTEEEYDHEKN